MNWTYHFNYNFDCCPGRPTLFNSFKKINFDIIRGILACGIRDSYRIFRSGGDDLEFDFKYGVDTNSYEDLFSHRVVGSNKNWATAYKSIRVKPFQKLLNAIDLPENSTFVDLGAGTGRALLVAAHSKRFGQVKGIEFSAQLYTQGLKNLEIAKPKCATKMTFVHQDIADFEPEANDQVFFSYDPCHADLLLKCLKKIEMSHRQFPRDIAFIYCINFKPNLNLIEYLSNWSQCELQKEEGNRFYIWRLKSLDSPAEKYVGAPL